MFSLYFSPEHPVYSYIILYQLGTWDRKDIKNYQNQASGSTVIVVNVNATRHSIQRKMLQRAFFGLFLYQNRSIRSKLSNKCKIKHEKRGFPDEKYGKIELCRRSHGHFSVSWLIVIIRHFSKQTTKSLFTNFVFRSVCRVKLNAIFPRKSKATKLSSIGCMSKHK